MKKVIVLAVLVLVLVAGAVAATLSLTGAFPRKADAKGGDAVKAAASAELAPPTYINLDPPFTVAFGQGDGPQFLQTRISLTTRDPEVKKTIDANMPAVRNSLVMLLSSQNPDELRARAGKEKLRAQALAAIQRIVKKYSGKTGIDEVLFTSFLMQ
jgi:flagellar FliL protein